MSILRKVAICLGVIIAFSAGSVFAASSTLSDYFDLTSRVFPDDFSISLSQAVVFNDNKDNRSNDEAHSSWELQTGVDIQMHRVLGNVVYGVDGSLGWTMYHHSNRSPEATLTLSPFVDFSQDNGNFMVSGWIDYKDDAISASDRRFAKYYDSNIKLAYDLNSHERYGVIIAGNYEYKYHTENEFENLDEAQYGISISPYVNVSSKTKVGIRAGYDRTDYRNNDKHDDMDEFYTNLFMNYRITLRINMTAEAGFTRVSYDGTKSEGTNGDDSYHPNYRLTLNYNVLSNLVLFARFSHQPEDSEELGSRGLSLRNESTVGATWAVNPKLTVTNHLSASLVDEKNSDWDNTEYEYNFRVDYALRERLSLYGTYTFSKTHFRYREDDDYKSNEIAMGVRWQF